MASKVSGSFTEQCRLLLPSSKSLQCIGSNSIIQKIETSKSNAHLFKVRIISGQPYSYMHTMKHSVSCYSMGTRNSEAKERTRSSEDCTNLSSDQLENEQVGGSSGQFYDQIINESASTYSIVYNDAKYVNERACNDIVLLSRGITRLNDRACQDVAVLGLGILKLDARVREDTEKIDHGMKKKAARFHHITTILKDKAQSKLKRVADQHWSDGALEADLRRADFVVRRRAMEDAFMVLKFVRSIHDMMASKLYQQPQKEGSFIVNDTMGFITLEKNGKSLDLLARGVSTDRITAIQEAYRSMASALSEADGNDYTNPEELELLVAALIDLDAMDGKGSVLLLAECSSSPNVSTRSLGKL